MSPVFSLLHFFDCLLAGVGNWRVSTMRAAKERNLPRYPQFEFFDFDFDLEALREMVSSSSFCFRPYQKKGRWIGGKYILLLGRLICIIFVAQT
jgi:hypothetical protein